MNKNITIGEKYGPAMTITTQEEAKAYFEKCVQHSMTYFGKTREEAEELERKNIGYYAGYYDQATMIRVRRLFGASHPIFPDIIDNPPTQDEALERGRQIGQRDD